MPSTSKQRYSTALTAAALVLGVSACEGKEDPPPPEPSAVQATADADDGEPEPEPDGPEEQEPEVSEELAEFLEVADCLEGKWEVDKSSDYWDLPFGDADEARGTIYIYFDPVSAWMLEYEDVYAYTMIEESIGSAVTVEWSGTTIGEYDVEDGFVVTEVTIPDITVHTLMEHDLGDEEDEYTVAEPLEMVYRCEGDQLLGYSVEEMDLDHPDAVFTFVE